MEITHSTRHIRGHGYAAVARNKGLYFIHYALMPETLTLVETSEKLRTADIHLHISIENIKGRIIYQHRRKIPFKTSLERLKQISDRKVVFRDFAPIIEGEFKVNLTFINDSTREFFSYQQNVLVKTGKESLSMIAGYQVKAVPANLYLPFSSEGDLVLTDPRSGFSQKDSIEGLVFSSETPTIQLRQITGKTSGSPVIPVETVIHRPDSQRQDSQRPDSQRQTVYKFRKPVSGIKDGTYHLTVKTPGGGIIERKIHIFPFYITVTHPFVMERPQPENMYSNYIFIRGQQYLNNGQADRAVSVF